MAKAIVLAARCRMQRQSATYGASTNAGTMEEPGTLT